MRVGIVTFAAGLALYVTAAIAQLAYDQPRPG